MNIYDVIILLFVIGYLIFGSYVEYNAPRTYTIFENNQSIQLSLDDYMDYIQRAS